jgi:hypothetical protein
MASRQDGRNTPPWSIGSYVPVGDLILADNHLLMMSNRWLLTHNLANMPFDSRTDALSCFVAIDALDPAPRLPAPRPLRRQGDALVSASGLLRAEPASDGDWLVFGMTAREWKLRRRLSGPMTHNELAEVLAAWEHERFAAGK